MKKANKSNKSRQSIKKRRGKASVGTPTAYNERKKYRKAFEKQYFGRKA